MGIDIIDLQHYRLDLHRRGSPTLVVTFEHVLDYAAKPLDRPGFLHTCLIDRAEDALYVKCKSQTWYRRHDWFEWLDKTGLFRRYQRVLTIGSSKGGYAALAFSRAMRTSQALAFAPLTTCAADLCPWETRDPCAAAEDWTGYARDAAVELSCPATIVLDPFEPHDKRHLARLPAHSVRAAPFPFVGHNVCGALRRLGALKAAIDAFVDGGDFWSVIGAAARRRRDLAQYWQTLIGLNEARGRSTLAARLRDAASVRDLIATA